MIYLDGAYRLHRAEDVRRFTELAKEAFPNYADRITCFGVDWLGRQFATDASRIAGGQPQVLLLEPGTGEALEVPVGYEGFHASELVEAADAAVAYGFFRQWLNSGGVCPSYGQCIGYKQPLFLGGADDVANLELADLDVYWSLSAQLLAHARGLPVGAKIGRVTLAD